jgi:hypothetical protein
MPSRELAAGAAALAAAVGEGHRRLGFCLVTMFGSRLMM